MKNEMRIEKNVPIPKYTINKQSTKYPFSQMEVGDSFLFNGRKGTLDVAINRWQKRLGWKFIYRTEKNGVRVWRVENKSDLEPPM